METGVECMTSKNVISDGAEFARISRGDKCDNTAEFNEGEVYNIKSILLIQDRLEY